MKNWVQLTVTADNTRGVQTICVGQFVSFSRKSDERILVAGKDLAYSLGFDLVPEQLQGRRLRGLDPINVLGDDSPARTYVMSREQKEKITHARDLALKRCAVHPEGLAYIGDHAFQHVRPMEFAKKPLLRHTYITTAALHQAGLSAEKLPTEGLLSELAAEDKSSLATWLTGGIGEQAHQIESVVKIDLIRVLREKYRLATL